ncbi:MAG TPA: hypothetical protein VF727_05875 [Allosphingosinicella sp.]|jgi:hypothetical protein
MLSALTLLLAVQTAPPPAGGYPTAEVLDAFAEVCRPIASLDGAAAAARGAGWQTFVPEPSSDIGQLLTFANEGAASLSAEHGAKVLPMVALRRTVAGEALIAVLSGVVMKGVKVNGCRVYDAGETREISRAAAEAWIKRPPSKVVEDPALHISTWEPGFDPRHDSFELYFIPAGSPAIEMVKVSGIALKADFVGAAD